MTLQSVGRKAINWFAPPPKTSDDGRDQWPSRASFVLACMGGAAGMGNLLRYPSVLYNNYGLQWFIPYLIAVVFIAIPVLTLEISIGQAYRGGSVTAYNAMNHRLKGVGMGIIFVAFIIGHYFVIILGWVMVYFRHSFQNPLPWQGRTEEFWDQVVGNPPPLDNGTFLDYSSTGLIGETVGWVAFTWFLVWLCIFRGVGLTGRVVYFTMGIPFIITIILVGRGVSLPNAGDGLGLVWATFRGDQLANGRLWQTAVGQVFFSTGLGFGYYTSYASYNAKLSNAVMDSLIVCASNVFFENFAALAIFGVIGFLQLFPSPDRVLGTYVVGFLTLPEAVVEMPVSQLWAVLVFLTLMVLGFSSSFAMLDAIVTLWMDSGTKLPRPAVVTILVIVSFLLSLPYCTQFGTYLLDGIDRFINETALVFVVFSECCASNVVYRWKDVVDQVGMKAFIAYNTAYFGGMIFGPAVGHAVSPQAGAAVGFGIFIGFTALSLLLASTPRIPAARLWNKYNYTSKLWYLAFYSGNQLRRDLNAVIGSGNNWKLPTFWPLLLRYVAAPALAIIFSFTYPSFSQLKNDPMYISGFILAHFSLVLVILGLIVPSWFDVFIPSVRREEGKFASLANEPQFTIDATEPDTASKKLEEGLEPVSSDDNDQRKSID